MTQEIFNTNNFKGRFSISQEEILELLNMPPKSSITAVCIDPNTDRVIFNVSTKEKTERTWLIPHNGEIPQTIMYLKNLIKDFIIKKLV
jgi:hypothetical protein